MSFFVYDLGFLIIVSILGSIFLYKRRKNLNREMGIFFLYRTKVGIKLIERVSKKYKKLLNSIKYAIIALGYLLMAGIIYLLSESVYSYVKYPLVAELINAPPVFPVIPYFPKIFGVESMFPPFYFTYFIIAFVVVAVVHEFAHGIYARLYKIKIKSTGFAFLGPLLAGAFVEQDEKQMGKAKKVDQMTILAAGVFANVILTIIAFLLLWFIFTINFVPGGAIFNAYSSSQINISSISDIGGIEVLNPTNQELISIINGGMPVDLTINNGEEVNLTRLSTDGEDYYFDSEKFKAGLEQGGEKILVYGDYPAINAGMQGEIIWVQDEKIGTYNDLSKVMPNYAPGQKINVKTSYKGEIFDYNLILAEDPNQNGRAIMGIGNTLSSMLKIEDRFTFFKVPLTKYNYKSGFLYFLYYLVFWVFLLNLLVAFFNMIPCLIFDGGRFFYLTVWGITKNEKIARKMYKWAGIIILASVVLLLVVWLLRKF